MEDQELILRLKKEKTFQENATWIERAAQELASYFSFGPGPDSYVTDGQRQEVADGYTAIIAKHVPRCETCAHWVRRPEYVTLAGECLDDTIGSDCNDYTIIVPADFGCVRWVKKEE